MRADARDFAFDVFVEVLSFKTTLLQYTSIMVQPFPVRFIVIDEMMFSADSLEPSDCSSVSNADIPRGNDGDMRIMPKECDSILTPSLFE